MNALRWERWAPLAGAVFAVLFVVGMLLLSDTPENDASNAEWVSHYADKGNRVWVIVGAYLVAFAGLAFLWFLGSLRTRLLAAEGGIGRLTGVAYGGGVTFVAMLFAGATALAAVPAGMSLGGAPAPGADVIRFLEQLGYGLVLLFGAFAAIALVAATALIVFRTGVFARWVGWLSLAVAVVLLFGVIYIPMLGLAIWAFVVSILMFRGAEAVPPAERAAADMP